MLIVIVIVVAVVFTGIFCAVRHQELKKGRDTYNLKDFIVELLNHTGDGSNYKR